MMGNKTHFILERRVIPGFIIIIVFLLSSCNESLPPRDEPNEFLAATCQADFSKNDGTNSVLYILISVKNAYTETFSQNADVAGTVVIEWKDHPQQLRHAPISINDLTFYGPWGGRINTQSTYSPFTNTITIPPGDSISLLYVWNYFNDAGHDLKRSFHYAPDPYDGTRLISDRETFVISASVRLFKSTPLSYSPPILYSEVHLYSFETTP